MSDLGNIKFLKGSARFAQAPEKSIQVDIPLSSTSKEVDEYQRQLSINLSQVFDDERQKSKLFQPTCKFQLIFSNAYSGVAQYDSTGEPYAPINNNLSYVNEIDTKLIQVLSPTVIAWPGQLQYNEFAFIRNDLSVDGYTTGLNFHLDGQPRFASTYNWSYYLSVPANNLDSKVLSYDFNDGGPIFNWTLSDGLPFIINRVSSDGKYYWQVRGPIPHNLSVGEYVRFSNIVVVDTTFSAVPGRDTFEVYSLGNGNFDSERFIFNILDVGFIQNVSLSFSNGKKGTFKRIIDDDNSIESESRYYIRQHRILTNPRDAQLTNAGFEKNAFNTKRKYLTAALTPNNFSRVAVLEDSQSYNLSFNSTIDLSPYRDNLNRPVTEMFFTVVQRGLFGYFNPPTPQGNGLKEGWEFNITSTTNFWWERSNVNSNVNLLTSNYTENGLVFNYNNFYFINNIINGPICEWNDIDQTETVLSKYYHKFVHNSAVFNIGSGVDNPFGYYYEPHYGVKLAVYSDYIEEGNPSNTVDVPNYAYYSKKNNTLIWRDIYPYGYVDSDGNGVTYPFMNNKHYPYGNFVFRIIPEGTNVTTGGVIQPPNLDGCE